MNERIYKRCLARTILQTEGIDYILKFILKCSVNSLKIHYLQLFYLHINTVLIE